MTGATRGVAARLLVLPLLVLAIAVPVAAWRTYWRSTPYDYSLSLHSRVLSPRVLDPLPPGVTVTALPVTIDNCPPDDSDAVCGRWLVLAGPQGLSPFQLRDQVVSSLVHHGWTAGTDHLYRGQVTVRHPGVAFAGVATAADEARWDLSQGGVGGPLPTLIREAQRDGRATVFVALEDCRSAC